MNPQFLSRWNDTEVLGRSRERAFRNEMALSYAAIAVSLIALITFCAEAGVRLIRLYDESQWSAIAELLLGKSLVGFFLLSALVYQLTRWGYLSRFLAHQATPDAELASAYRDGAPRLVILVPSSKEEPRMVHQTLVAAALQQSPNRRVVLLIDDPPAPPRPDDAARLAATRDLPREVGALLAGPARTFAQALDDYVRRRQDGSAEPRREIRRLAGLLHEAADWLDGLAADTVVAATTRTRGRNRSTGWPAGRSRAACGTPTTCSMTFPTFRSSWWTPRGRDPVVRSRRGSPGLSSGVCRSGLGGDD